MQTQPQPLIRAAEGQTLGVTWEEAIDITEGLASLVASRGSVERQNPSIDSCGGSPARRKGGPFAGRKKKKKALPPRLQDQDALLLFEVLQLPNSFQDLQRAEARGKAFGHVGGAHRVAWAFLRLRGPAGQPLLGELALQLFEYRSLLLGENSWDSYAGEVRGTCVGPRSPFGACRAPDLVAGFRLLHEPDGAAAAGQVPGRPARAPRVAAAAGPAAGDRHGCGGGAAAAAPAGALVGL